MAVATTTSVTSSAPTSLLGQPVTFTATITANGESVTSGTVTFLENGNVLATGVSLNSSGQAVYTTSSLSTGSYVITVVYNGTSNYLPSSNTVNQTITANQPVPQAVPTSLPPNRSISQATSGNLPPSRG